MDTIGLGILGCGFIGQTHAWAIKKYTRGAHLAAVSGGHQAPALAAELGADCEPALEALLNRPDIAGVIIATPHALHAAQTLAALRAGKHVLVEKPMATRLADCDAMIAAVTAGRRVLMLAHTQRFRDGNMQAKTLVSEGRLGRVLAAEEEQHLGTLADMGGWGLWPESLGTLLGGGVHNFDRLRWLLEDEVRSVYAQCRTDRVQVPIETDSMCLLTFRKGAMATFWCCWEAPSPGFPGVAMRLRLLGSDELMDLDAYGALRVTKAGAWETVYEQPPIDFRGGGKYSEVRMASFARQEQAFVEAIRAGSEPPVTGVDGRASVEIALACYLSSRRGQVVRLPLSPEDRLAADALAPAPA